MGNFFHFFAN